MRRFNRFYTRQIGVLRKTFLDSPYSLGEARVLYEIASGRSLTASEIGRALDLDAGYLSRVLRNFEKRGLIQRKASASDARQSHLALSPRGRKAYAPLERRSQRDTGAMLGKPRARRSGATDRGDETIETLLGGDAEATPSRRQPTTSLRAPVPGDFGWIVKRHAELYAQEYQWTEPFEGLCAQIVADFANKNDAKRERCWIAEMDGENVGCVFLVRRSARPSPASGCCWSTRRRAGSGSARGSPTNASASPAAPATRRSRYGPTACSPQRATFIRKPAFRLMRSEKHRSWGRPVISEHWDLEL